MERIRQRILRQIAHFLQVIRQAERFHQATMPGHQHGVVLGDPLLLAIFVIAQHHENLRAFINPRVEAGVGQIGDLLAGFNHVIGAGDRHHNGLFQPFLRLRAGLQQQASQQQRKLAHCVSL